VPISLLLGRIILTVLWAAWVCPFLLFAPKNQKRPSITSAGPTRIGLLLECCGFILAAVFHIPASEPVAFPRLAASVLFWAPAVVVFWTAVQHLGRQFRITAGLYEDHQLVRTGPYAIVRHPIYSSLLAMLLSTICMITQWTWAIPALVLFLAGTEIRVRTEDRLLASRFGKDFADYRRRVPAYLPFVR